MTGLSHGIISWFVAQGGGEELRDRRLIAWLGVAPDFDSIAYVAGAIPTLNIDDGYQLYVEVHHHYTHGFAMMGLAALICLVFGRQRIRTALLASISVLVHLVCDIVGSGPEFPVYPWWPIDNEPFGAAVAAPRWRWSALPLTGIGFA